MNLLGLVVLLVVVGVLLYPSLASYSRLSMARLFSLALAAPGDSKICEALFDKTKFILVDDFRSSCLQFNKPLINLPPDELFNYFRNRALADAPTLPTDSEVEIYIRIKMRDLAAVA